MNRIIPCIVSNEYVKGDGVSVGAAGSHNDVVLELHFTDFWEGLSKSITWLDANGENPTITMLTTDMLKPGESDAYLVPIPAEPKRVAGTMTMSIKGAAVSGESETRASLTTTAHFKVLESVYDEDAAEAGDITATQAEQMQGQLESILNDIVLAGQAADAKEAAEASANAAEASAEAAVTQANAAAQSASSALFSEQQAQTFANAAQTAQSAAEAAQSSAEAAADEAAGSAQTAQTAKTGAESARDAAESAKTGAENAATEAASSEDEARQYALDASASANMAATNAASAGAAATAASGSASAAASSAAQAQQYAEQAGQIVGGDFATKTELSTGLAGKADLVGGKVPASQLPAMDYDASGSAAAALTAAMSYADGLASNYDASGAAESVQSNLNSHVADTTKHITAEERTAWNGKATQQDIADAIASIPTPDVSGQIATHNSDETAHSDIRQMLPNMSVYEPLLRLNSGLGNEWIWEKCAKSFGEVSDVYIGIWYGGASNTIKYADDVEITSDSIALKNPTSITVNPNAGTDSLYTAVRGKYFEVTTVHSGTHPAGVYYGKEDGTIITNGSGWSRMGYFPARLVALQNIGYVNSPDENAYSETPDADGYYYKKIGRVGGVLGGTKLVLGGYVGTGTYGENNPNVITFDGKPMFVRCYSNGSTADFQRGDSDTQSVTWADANSNKVTLGVIWGENRLSFYRQSGYSSREAFDQLNTAGEKYKYIAILV